MLLNTQKYLIDKKVPASGYSFNEARKYFYSKGIKWSYDSDEQLAQKDGPRKRRVIMTANHNMKHKINDPIIQECNGLILEAGTWRILNLPLSTLSYHINNDKCNEYLQQGLYHIYQVEDGTIFNMYYFNNKWIISTSKGYEMNNVKWGSHTYQEIISELLDKYDMSWESFCAKLKINMCYTFGFKHPEFHPFREGKEEPIYKLWLVNIYDINPNSSSYLWSFDTDELAPIPKQVKVKDIISNVRELYHKANESVERFKDDKEVNYGYILRSVVPNMTGYHSNLIIESALMSCIRKTWYDNNLIKYCQEMSLNKDKFIPLLAYLDNDGFQVFSTLFEQYKELFEVFSNKMTKLVKFIYNIRLSEQDKKQDKNLEKSNEKNIEKTTEIKQDEYLEKTYIKLKNSIDDTFLLDIKTNKEDYERNLLKYLTHPKFGTLLYNYLYEQNE